SQLSRQARRPPAPPRRRTHARPPPHRPVDPPAEIRILTPHRPLPAAEHRPRSRAVPERRSGVRPPARVRADRARSRSRSESEPPPAISPPAQHADGPHERAAGRTRERRPTDPSIPPSRGASFARCATVLRPSIVRGVGPFPSVVRVCARRPVCELREHGPASQPASEPPPATSPPAKQADGPHERAAGRTRERRPTDPPPERKTAPRKWEPFQKGGRNRV